VHTSELFQTDVDNAAPTSEYVNTKQRRQCEKYCLSDLLLSYFADDCRLIADDGVKRLRSANTGNG